MMETVICKTCGYQSNWDLSATADAAAATHIREDPSHYVLPRKAPRRPASASKGRSVGGRRKQL